MFASIAPVYDLMNKLMSGGSDRTWRKNAAAHCKGARRVLDVACGTGDLAAEIRAPTVVGSDFTRAMLRKARTKYRARAAWMAADALRLPHPDGAFDAVTIAFGVRNFADLRRGLRELRRVLRPGGRLVILELVMPDRGVAKKAYSLYLDGWIPSLGRALAPGPMAAYRYLSESIQEFGVAADLAKIVRDVGFEQVDVEPQTMGVAAIVTGVKGPETAAKPPRSQEGPRRQETP